MVLKPEDFRMYITISGKFYIRCWRRKEEISWTDSGKNEVVLHGVKEERSVLHAIKRRLCGLVTSRVGTAF